MNSRIVSAIALASVFALSACSSDQQEQAAAPVAAPAPVEQVEKPAMMEAVSTMMEATVTAVDLESREVTLQNAEGDSVTLIVGEEAKNLPQVEVGDIVQVEYLEAVSVQVFEPDQIETGAEVVAAKATAEPGEKPAGVVAEELIVVAEIMAIDMERELVTLQGPGGETKTVKARNPDNLKKVVVGDKVMITYTEAIAINVIEKPAAE
jgi:hypothetical protein